TAVTVATVPAGLTVGSPLLGSTVTAIAGNAITLAANASTTINSATNVPFVGGTNATGSTLAMIGTGAITLHGANLYLDGTTPNGRLLLSSTVATTLTATLNSTITADAIIMQAANTATFTVTGGTDVLTINGRIMGNDLAMTKAGLGTLALNGASTYN